MGRWLVRRGNRTSKGSTSKKIISLNEVMYLKLLQGNAYTETSGSYDSNRTRFPPDFICLSSFSGRKSYNSV